ncbi:MAG TPA: 4-hydroxy-tetrahydrodipicolinate reductase [Polyangia bacterium]|jgi:4-hydroxy-tetrahydrodipicolinate reductase|nr:4-hydroxy-tetrahydrodipicolinate reductase [Polyangia bacterium]
MRIAILGADGKMGRALVRAVVAAGPEAKLTAATERAGSPALGADAGSAATGQALGVAITAGVPATSAADVWIDFTVPAATVAYTEAAVAANAALVIGTTGLGAEQKAAIERAAKKVPVVFSANYSVGVNVMLKLIADAARTLGPSYDLEIVETHHRAKRDAPSGTALRLAEALAEATGRDLAKEARYERHGEIGPRTQAEIGIQTLRGGDVIGDHTAHFMGIGDRIEITHRASSRDTFAVGAVRAALWLKGRTAGLYDMRAVLDLI